MSGIIADIQRLKNTAKTSRVKLPTMSEVLENLRRSALILVVIGLAWNLVEAAIAFWATLQSGSIALLAFGLDSIVELVAGGILVWRLQANKDDHNE